MAWEGGVVTSSSFVRTTKRGLDGGLTVILGFLEMWFVDPCVEDMVTELCEVEDEVQDKLAMVKLYIGKSWGI